LINIFEFYLGFLENFDQKEDSFPTFFLFILQTMGMIIGFVKIQRYFFVKQQPKTIVTSNIYSSDIFYA